jgi:hypothetical protein
MLPPDSDVTIVFTPEGQFTILMGEILAYKYFFSKKKGRRDKIPLFKPKKRCYTMEKKSLVER